mgnify:CR=1 FL=1
MISARKVIGDPKQISLILKAEASVLIRLEIGKGKSDDEALYMLFGHSFRVHYRGLNISGHGGYRSMKICFY